MMARTVETDTDSGWAIVVEELIGGLLLSLDGKIEMIFGKVLALFSVLLAI